MWPAIGSNRCVRNNRRPRPFEFLGGHGPALLNISHTCLNSGPPQSGIHQQKHRPEPVAPEPPISPNDRGKSLAFEVGGAGRLDTLKVPRKTHTFNKRYLPTSTQMDHAYYPAPPRPSVSANNQHRTKGYFVIPVVLTQPLLVVCSSGQSPGQ